MQRCDSKQLSLEYEQTILKLREENRQLSLEYEQRLMQEQRERVEQSELEHQLWMETIKRGMQQRQNELQELMLVDSVEPSFPALPDFITALRNFITSKWVRSKDGSKEIKND